MILGQTTRQRWLGWLFSLSLVVAIAPASCTALAEESPAAKAAPAPASLKLEKGDRICLIGNTLAERMQHFGHFETLLHSRFPELELVVRNLGYSADELSLRPRSANFGSTDDHLERHKADVVLALFGYNESFAGEAGLPKFEKDLEAFITTTLGQKYNRKTAPRLVLISPIAFENLGDPNLPDGSEQNANLKLYTAAMRRIAAQHNVPFVDLFTPTLSLLADENTKLTFNGCHLTDAGYRVLAPVLVTEMFGLGPVPDEAQYERLRKEVNEKAYQFFHRYRAVNGFYIYGGRSGLDFGVKELSNHIVMENERGKLDDMCAVRDARIWAVAQGKTVPVDIDDSGTRKLMEVPTNYHRPITYLSAEEALKTFALPDGFQMSLFASEVEFPELANPTQMAFDARGRLWVCTMQSYPQYLPPHKPNDKILILEDTDGDGRADKSTVFVDKLHLPTGFAIGDGGAYVAQQPNLVFFKDTDGDDKADQFEYMLHGFDSADSHHSISAFTWGPDGALYFQEGTFHHSQIETPYGATRVKNAAVFRFEPKTKKLDVYVSYGFANPWGHIFDRWGQDFVSDASGGANYYAAAFSGNVDYPNKHKGMKQFLTKQYRPTAGTEIVASPHFPAEYQTNFLITNCIGFQGVANYKLSDDGAGFHGEPVDVLLKSSDPNFRPVDIKFGPDGALYVCDWQNALIGHMQHHIRDPNRDTTHGRVWRITYAKNPLNEPPAIAGEPVNELLDLLEAYEDRTRYQARLELRNRDTEEVLAALKVWLDGLDKADEQYEHNRLEALWIYRQHNRINEPLLVELLRSDDYRVRAAATRVLCYCRDQVSDPLALLKVQAGDEHPRVRLEAVRACSFFTGEEALLAAEAALESLQFEQDDYLKYTFEETMQTLDKYLK
jgi:glucose/arabinose dehydrogenase